MAIIHQNTIQPLRLVFMTPRLLAFTMAMPFVIFFTLLQKPLIAMPYMAIAVPYAIYITRKERFIDSYIQVWGQNLRERTPQIWKLKGRHYAA